MLIIFLVTGQQLSLTVTAVLATGGIATLAVFFYGREESRNEMEEGGHPEELVEAATMTQADEAPTLAQPAEAQTPERD